ncbi:rhodanese-like domain-containing protein [Nocardioides sp. KIGAM211]|uniref:Rhodanese-like domain-containing protein n=1 Tax=Nocardioides luti TaxID=2761101 RepID=A0A7X0VBD0_9ACTN|nr:rhodanese-like domain-containing protein [Nocardioides luti]MBB6627867.1 rhodanese-like domain-containing protein [Nocardioides luti]
MLEIDVDRLAAKLDRGAVLVDVREPAEYAAGHVPGAVSIPMGRLSARMGDLSRLAPVHVICASGNRSRAMCDLLAAGGYDAVDVTGGTRAWIASGRPVEVGAR